MRYETVNFKDIPESSVIYETKLDSCLNVLALSESVDCSDFSNNGLTTHKNSHTM